MAKQVTITRKIRLIVNTPNKEERNEFINRLCNWRDICVNIANMAITQMYINLKGDNFSFLREKTKAELQRPENFNDLTKKEQKEYINEENKLIYKLIEEERREHGMTPEITYYYNLLSSYYKTSVRTAVISALNTNLLANFNSEKSEYLLNKTSLRTYKQNMPIPITSQSIRGVRRSTDENGKEYRDFAFNLFGIPLRTYLGKDKSNNERMLSQGFSSWFLPEVVFNREGALSEAIMSLRLNQKDRESNSVDIEGIIFQIEYKQLDKEPMKGARLNEGRHRYIVSCQINEKDYTFFIGPKEPKRIPNTKEYEITGYKIVDNIKFSDSGLQVITERTQNDIGKFVVQTNIFLLATFKFDARTEWELEEDKTAYCELGIDVPIIVKIGNSRQIEIGTKGDLFYQRTGIQGSLRRTQRDLKGTKGGKGRKRKLKPLGRYKKFEKNLVNDKLHNYSSKLIKICLENKVKNIILVGQKEKEKEAKGDEILLRNWSYHGMKNMIAYKAKAEGMDMFEE